MSRSVAMGPLHVAASLARAAEVGPLFNGHDLSGWDRYLGVREVPALTFGTLVPGR